MENVKRCLLALSTAVLVSCSSWEPISKTRSEDELAKYPRATFTEAGLKARYSNATSLDYSIQHGTQISYTSPNGDIYLWYPGNAQLIIGQWRVDTNKHGSGRICFKYTSLSYNTVTRSFGGNWDCVRAADYIWQENEFSRGDPLNLASGRMPFVLEKLKQYSFSDIGQITGLKVNTSL